MKNFQLLATNLDTMPLLHQLQRQPELWDQNTLRTKHPGTAHSQVSDIWVWFNEISELIADDKDVRSYDAWHLLPAIRPIVFGLMRQVEGVRLGRVIITKLPVGKTITPHVDMGAPATYYSRYQIALQSLPGAMFTIETEKVNFKSGEIWWINNEAEHSVMNNSADDRIVMIVDIRNC